MCTVIDLGAAEFYWDVGYANLTLRHTGKSCDISKQTRLISMFYDSSDNRTLAR